MLFATAAQGQNFIWMMASGIGIGIWYALTALLRRCMQAGFWLTLACDLLFGAGSAVIFILALVTGNYGRLRFFEALAALLGFLLFICGVYLPLRMFDSALLRRLRKIMAFIAKNRRIKVIFK